MLGLAQVYNISDHCVVAILELLLSSDCQRFLNQSRMCLYIKSLPHRLRFINDQIVENRVIYNP